MAAKKEKVVSFKGDEAEELVLSYLRSQNRPYGATDISANLKSKVSKVQAQKTLATLHEKGEILGKVYGKTTVYCALQTESEDLEGVDITAVEGELATFKAEELQLKTALKSIIQEKAETIRDPPTSELESTLATIKSKNQTLESSLAPLRASTSNSTSSSQSTCLPISTVSTTELTSLNKSFVDAKSIALNRRKIGLEIESTLMEIFEKKKGDESEVWELIGGDRDENIIEDEEGIWIAVKEVEGAEAGKGKS